MRKFFRDAKDAAFRPNDKPQQSPFASPGPQPPSTLEILRYRYSHGTNLGSIFVLERWLTPHLFPDTTSETAEIAAAQASISTFGLDSAHAKFEAHWNDYVSDADLDWLVEAGTTSVRLPIGFFTLGPEFCRGTAFENVSGLYINAWAAVERLVGRCWTRGIGVLLDLHALPGGANDGDHSGINTGKAEFWGSEKYKALATRCLTTIAERAESMPGVLGLQLVNEAEHAAVDRMWDWYDAVAAEIYRIDPGLPLYISDAWQLAATQASVASRNRPRVSTNPLVIDDHLYWCFSDADKTKTPEQIHGFDVLNALSSLENGNVSDHGARDVVVGEYSCVLADEIWARGGDKNTHVRAFGDAQSKLHQSRTGGSYFWTYRMQWMDGGEWGYRQTTRDRAIKAPGHLLLGLDEIKCRVDRAKGQKDAKLQHLFETHCAYWGAQGGKYEHHRFETGLGQGWDDAEAFFGSRSTGKVPGVRGGDRIGLLDLWVLKRIRETDQGTSKFAWEFEQGLRQGIAAYCESVDI